MLKLERGEVWLTDMGIAGKVRPCLLLTSYPSDDELALALSFHTPRLCEAIAGRCQFPRRFSKQALFTSNRFKLCPWSVCFGA